MKQEADSRDCVMKNEMSGL